MSDDSHGNHPSLARSGPLAYAPDAGRWRLGARARVALAGGYVALTLLPCLVIGMAGVLPMRVLVGTFLAYAFALLPTYYLDHWLLGGHGFHSPRTFGVFIVCVATMLWPLPLLAATPGAWRSIWWRRAILAYAAALLAFAAAAAVQMTRSWGMFFG